MAKKKRQEEQPEERPEESAAAPSADDADPSEDEIARMEAEMAAAVAAEEAEAYSGDQTGDAESKDDDDELATAPPPYHERRLRGSIDDSVDLGPISEVSVPVSVVVFEKETTIGELISVELGTIIRGHSSEQPLELRVGTRPVARGRAVVVDDRFGVLVDELIDT